MTNVILMLALACLMTGCAASRSPLTGAFNRQAEKNYGADKTTVCFLFRHQSQMHGFDTIPKLNVYGVKDFNNLFREALPEITNIGSYTTFTESPADVDEPKRREELSKMRAESDYTLKIDFFEETSFKQQFFNGTISLLTLTVLPMPYSWDYTISAELYDRKGRLLRSYQRKATLNNWVEILLVFVYPFHPLEGKREAIYSEALHDIFRQIEAEKVLKAAAGTAAGGAAVTGPPPGHNVACAS